MYALFATAVPLSGLIGAPLSGWIMSAFNEVHGYAGWQWLFFLEGLPSIAVGFLVVFCLSDRISSAGWLTREEKPCCRRALTQKPSATRNTASKRCSCSRVSGC